LRALSWEVKGEEMRKSGLRKSGRSRRRVAGGVDGDDDDDDDRALVMKLDARWRESGVALRVVRESIPSSVVLWCSIGC
jgi:hypothetical protein